MKVRFQKRNQSKGQITTIMKEVVRKEDVLERSDHKLLNMYRSLSMRSVPFTYTTDDI